MKREGRGEMTKVTSCVTHVIEINDNNNERLTAGPTVKQNEFVWTFSSTLKI